MFKFRLFDLLEATWHLEIAQEDAEKQSESGVGKLSDIDQQIYQKDVNRMRALCESFQLESALDQLDRIDITITRGSLQGAYKTFTEQTQQVWVCLKTDLDKRVFMFMPPTEAKYYEREELFGPEVKARFPEANKEIVAAGNCYATGSYTACVFHLMRAVELGARAMVYDLKVDVHLIKHGDRVPVELCDWGMLLSALEKGVNILSTGTRTDMQKREEFEFYNHAVGSFRNFKDAWRNHVSHTREMYLGGQTKDIMDNTRQFMKHLAERLKE